MNRLLTVVKEFVGQNKLIASIVVAVALVGGIGFLIAISPNQQVQDFGDQREQVVRNYIFSVLGGNFTDTEGTYRCDEYDEFIEILKIDSREMTIAQLEKAISLHDSCSYSLTSEQFNVDNELSSSISELVGLSTKIRDKESKELAKQITDKWRQIHLLKTEKTALMNKSVGNQAKYWKAELGNKQGKDSFSQRQDAFKKLNTENEEASKRDAEIDLEMKTIKATENDLWSEFVALTDYEKLEEAKEES